MEQCTYHVSNALPLIRWKKEIISHDPSIAIFHDFVSDTEAKQLIRIATPRVSVHHFELTTHLYLLLYSSWRNLSLLATCPNNTRESKQQDKLSTSHVLLVVRNAGRDRENKVETISKLRITYCIDCLSTSFQPFKKSSSSAGKWFAHRMFVYILL